MANLYPVTQTFKLYTGLDGLPLNGGYIYFGTANQNPQTTPTTMYWDVKGTIVAAQPLRTVNGYISQNGLTPANIYATGDFSVTILDSKSQLVLTSPVSVDLQLALSVTGGSLASAIPIIDAGAYYPTDNVEAAFQTLGPLIAQMVTALAGAVPTGARFGFVGTVAPTGYVLGSGNTIGDVASGATERANADTVNLYTLLWNSYANAQLAIQDSAGTPTTRGVSASADYAAHKRLSLPDYRGRVPAGKDNMGGSTASRLTAAGSGIDGTVMGNSGGAETHALSTAELATHGHAFTANTHTHTATDAGHTHTVPLSLANSFAGGGIGGFTNSGSVTTGSGTASVTNSSTVVTGTNATAGSGTAHTSTQPTIIETMIIKL